MTKDQKFALASRKPIEEYEEAQALGYQTRPVLVGPVTFLKLAKSKDAGFNPLSLLDRLLPVYIEVLRELVYRGAEWVQIDEPCLVLDLDIVGQQALHYAYAEIAKAVPQLKIMLATYFGGLGGNRDTALALPVAGLHLDLVRAPEQIDDLEGASEGPRAVARRHRRPQHLARGSEPRFSIGSSPSSRSSARIACRSRPPARCCMSRSIWRWRPGSIPKSRAGWRFRCRRSRN